MLRAVTEEIEGCRLLEADVGQEQQTNASVKAMIFDYERLKRVLEEERNYFKELSCSEEKSHEDRVRELRKILDKLVTEEKSS